MLRDMSPGVSEYMRCLRGEAAVTHLFRVTSGLESQILGEEEVTGQVRSAIHVARDHSMLGPSLDSLCRAALACSRRLRRETELGRQDVNVASTAAAIARAHVDLERSSVLIIGRGNVAKMLAAEFRNVGRLIMASRTQANLAATVRTFGIDTLSLDESISRLSEFDVICCATRTRSPILTKDHFSAAQHMLVFDLSIPRAVAAELGDLSNVKLFDIDDVTQARAGVPADRSGLYESIVDSEVHEFLGRDTVRKVAPIIAALREHVDRVTLEEIERIQRRLANLERDEREAVESAISRMTDRMFHHLVTRLRLAALSDPELIRAAEFFFGHGETTLFPSDPEGELVTAEDLQASGTPGSG